MNDARLIQMPSKSVTFGKRPMDASSTLHRVAARHKQAYQFLADLKFIPPLNDAAKHLRWFRFFMQ
jgi:hypothetical protein